jgi:hypothetical protein
MPVVEPGPPGTAASRRRAEELRALDRSQLALVRATAEKWRNGLAALLALITAVSVVKGRGTVEDLSQSAKIAVGVLMLLALVAAAAGTLLAMRAAFGLPARRALTGEADELDVLRDRQALDAAHGLRLAIALTLLSLALLAGAVGVDFYGPPADKAKQNLRVTTPSTGEVCGTVQSSASGSVTLKTSAGPVVVELVDALVRTVPAC